MRLRPDLAIDMPEKQTFKQWWTLIKSATAAWIDDYAPSIGASLSYYTIFSLAPLLLIVISVAGLFFGTEAVRGEIFGQLRGLMGDDAAKAIEAILSTVSKPSESITAAVIGVAVLLVGATAAGKPSAGLRWPSIPLLLPFLACVGGGDAG